MKKTTLKNILRDIDGTDKKHDDMASEFSSRVDSAQKGMFHDLAKHLFSMMREYFDKEMKSDKDKNASGFESLQAGFTRDIQSVLETFSALKKQLDGTDNLTKAEVKELKAELEALVDSYNDTSREAGIKVEGVSERVDEIFNVLDGIDERIEKALKPSASSISKLDKKIADAAKDIASIKKGETKSFKSFEQIAKKFKELEEAMKKLSKGLYDYGASFSILKDGLFVGQTFGVNFAAGTNTTVSTTVNAQGFITIAINATGGGSFSGTQEKSTTAPDGVTTTFAFAHTPKVIVWNGAIQTLTDDYTVSGNNVIFTSSAGVPKSGDKILNIYA